MSWCFTVLLTCGAFEVTAVSGTGPKQSEGEGALLLLELAGWVSQGCRAGGVAIVARGADGTGQGERRDGRYSGGSGEMMSEMSLSGRDSIPQEGTAGGRNARMKRAVRISSIVAQEVSIL
ncbi:hypothetical protein AOLI_G00047830 [Acnodon oligacanthus]